MRYTISLIINGIAYLINDINDVYWLSTLYTNTNNQLAISTPMYKNNIGMEFMDQQKSNQTKAESKNMIKLVYNFLEFFYVSDLIIYIKLSMFSLYKNKININFMTSTHLWE